MIPAVMTMWALCAPMGYLAGDVFVARNMPHDSEFGMFLPWAGALIPPFGAILALMLILQTTK